jgi:predicted component of type VI protein secretion system
MPVGDQPTYDRRATDRFLARIERDVRDLRDKLEQLDREGSRVVGVLLQQVKDADTRRTDLVAGNERAHERLWHALTQLEDRVERLDNIVIKTNLDKLPERVATLEVTGQRRSGLTAGLKTAVGIYAAVGVAALGLVLQVALR